jgi:F420-non-reducing hydrogenase small subunit
MEKPKIALCWCSGCGGCEESVLDLAEDILNLREAVDIVFWPVALDFKYADLKALKDKELIACFINGAIRTKEHEELVKLLREKSRYIFAQGSCAHLGGVSGLANFFASQELLRNSYIETPNTKNPKKILPGLDSPTPEDKVALPHFLSKAKSLDQAIEVDYYIPGCPAPAKIIKNALTLLLENKLPSRGSVLAQNKSLCESCSRKESRPEKISLKGFKRLYNTQWDPQKCFLEEGIICLCPVTRGGCEERCIKANMPCRGCFGPLDGVKDFGAKAVSFLASLIGADGEKEIKKSADSIADPAGLFYRYSLAKDKWPRR